MREGVPLFLFIIFLSFICHFVSFLHYFLFFLSSPQLIFAGNMLTFLAGSKQAFEVSLADVSQTQLQGKNDVILEFHVDDTTGANEVCCLEFVNNYLKHVICNQCSRQLRPFWQV